MARRRTKNRLNGKLPTTTKIVNGQSRTITTTAAGKQADVSPKPFTGMYKPIPHIWFQHPIDLPAFTFNTIRAMLMDEGIRLNFATREAPIYGVKFGWEESVEGSEKKAWKEGVKCKDPAVASFIYRQLQRIWKTYLPDILRAQVWGWSCGEVTLKLSKDTGLVEIGEMLSRHPMDCRLLKKGYERWGVQVTRVEGNTMGTINLPFPYAWFHSYGSEDGEDYGTSAAYGAYSPWADKWFEGGAKDVRRLFMHKDAYGGVDLAYPDGETFIAGYDQPIPNADLARRIAESVRAGGVTTRPSERDEHGNEKWPLTRSTVSSNPQHILDYPKDLDGEIRHGMGIPDDVINSGTTGAWNGKAIPMQSFYSSLDGWVVRLLRDLCKQIIDPLLMLNFGMVHEYETPFMPLAEQAAKQQDQSQQNNNQAATPQDAPNHPGMNMQGSALPPEQQQDRPIAMSVAERVGSGELSAADILKAARETFANAVSKPEKPGCVMLACPDDVTNLVKFIQDQIDPASLTEDGYEDWPHVTVVYGIQGDDMEAVESFIKQQKPVEVELGEISTFPKDGGSCVLKIAVQSEQLNDLHDQFNSRFEIKSDYDQYRPHITIAYCSQEEAEKFVGKFIGTGHKCELGSFLLSMCGKESYLNARIPTDYRERLDALMERRGELPELPPKRSLATRLVDSVAKLFGIKRMSSDAKNGERWITIGAERTVNGEKTGGTPVKIDKDGKMLTGKFAGKTLEEAFKKGGEADKQNNSPEKPDSSKKPDQAIVNVPLNKRPGGSLDSQIDKHKAEQAKQAKIDRSFKAKQAKDDKAVAKELFDKHADRIAQSTADKTGADKQEALRTLESMVQWEPAKARSFFERVARQHEADGAKHLDGAAYPNDFKPDDKQVARMFASAVARTDSSSDSRVAAMEAINYAQPGYIESELSKPISFASQRIARVAANAVDPDSTFTKKLLNDWADLHDKLPASDQVSDSPKSEVFREIEEKRPLIIDALKLSGLIRQRTAAEEEAEAANKSPEQPAKQPEFKKVSPSSIDTPAQAALNSAREAKKNLRERVKKTNGIERLKAQYQLADASKAEEQALDQIEERARQLGKTIGRKTANERDRETIELHLTKTIKEGRKPDPKLLERYKQLGGDETKFQ